MLVAKWPENTFPATYTGETGRRLNELIIEHTGKDQNLEMFKQKFQGSYPSISSNKFTIIRNK